MKDKPTYFQLENQITELKHENNLLKQESSIKNLSLTKKNQELSKSKLKLERSESNLYALINNRDESIWSVDNNLNYLIFNDFFKKAYRDTFAIELKKGLNALDIISPKLYNLWKLKYDAALSGRRVVFEISNTVEGQLHYYNVILSPILSNSQIIGVSGLSVDITKEKEIEKKLIEEKANLSAILENTTDSIWAINKNYEILYTNEVFTSAFYTSFGVQLEPNVNLLLSLPETIRPTWKSRYDRALDNERFSFVDSVDIGGSYLHIEVRMNPIIADGELVGASFFGKDITERINNELALKENEIVLKELNDTKDKIFSVIAHDLRSPFNSIIGYSDLLENNLRDYSLAKIQKFNSIILSTAQNTLNLLDNLLDWAKSQTGQDDFKQQKISLNEVISELFDFFSSALKMKNIEIDYIGDKNIKICADFNMINIILRNLISNAIKFTSIKGRIEVKTRTKEQFVEISVSDNGVGIDQETLEKLFSVNSNTIRKGTSGEKGSGFGLLLCKEFVEKHSCGIWVDSEVGKGSKFTFTMPIFLASEKSLSLSGS